MTSLGWVLARYVLCVFTKPSIPGSSVEVYRGLNGKWGKVDETQGFLTLGHSNWTIFSLLNQFCFKKIPTSYPASNNKPFLYTVQRRRKEGAGAENGKGNFPKVNDTKRCMTLGHLNWTIYSLLSRFCHKKLPPFCPASHNNPILYTAEKGREEGAGAEDRNWEFIKSGRVTLEHWNWTIWTVMIVHKSWVNKNVNR